MVPPVAATPPRHGAGGGWSGSAPSYPYEYEHVSPGTPYSSRGGAGTVGMPPPHSPYYGGGAGGHYRGGPPPPPPDFWGEPPTPTRGSGGGYWGPPPPSTHSGPYHDAYRMVPSMRGGMQHHYHPYPHYRSPMRRGVPPYVSPGEPLSPGANHYAKDFRPPAPAAARGPTSDVEKKEDKGDNKEEESSGDATDKKKGDALSVLADVSAGMDGKDKKKSEAATDAAEGDKKDETGAANQTVSVTTPARPPVPVPAPTSPLQRRSKPSPITPSQTPHEGKNRSGASVPATPGRHQPITPSRSQDSAHTNADPSGSSWEAAPPIPPGVSSEASYPPTDYSPHPQGPYTPVRSHGRPPYGGDFAPPHPTDSPALVERGSFDSHGDASTYRNPPFPPATPPSRAGFFYDDGPPPGYGSGNGGSYWEAAGPSPYSPSYRPPPRGAPGTWNHPPPPPPAAGPHHDPYYPPPPPPGEYGPPPTRYGEEDAVMGPPPYGHGPPPSHHYRGPPGPPPHHYPGMHGPPPPYGYMQHPRMEEKTILRKKFSWKHYPELERFLIANRDEYLKHSNMNYTAEQKQYNNWLTERLMEVAGQHNYLFDPEDFNFVAIRDRIRCYYKSYVQTARKRGLKLPEKKKD